MSALGIPTTRAASLVVTDTYAQRDPFYNGRVKNEQCAVVLRLAPSFWRFGSFEIFKGNGGRGGPRYFILRVYSLDDIVMDFKMR